jgi:hypothetical protein
MASTYLSKTFGSAGNRKTWTWSAWIKRNNLITSRIFCTLASGVDDFIKFDTSHRLEWGFDHEDLSNRGKLITNRVFRDVRLGIILFVLLIQPTQLLEIVCVYILMVLKKLLLQQIPTQLKMKMEKYQMQIHTL